jgi:hypothetical protein
MKSGPNENRSQSASSGIRSFAKSVRRLATRASRSQ